MSDTGVRPPALGPRGEGYVVAQFLLLAWIFAAGRRRVEPLAPRAGAVTGLAGVVLAVWSLRSLGASLTPLPRPRAGAELVVRGPYRRARHPVYGGGLLGAAGWALGRSSRAFAPTAALALLWQLKSRREELWLEQRYDGYAAYRRRTPRRFFPL